MRLIDLSNPVGPHWKWGARLTPVMSLDNGDFCAVTQLTVTTHEYTHVDVPAHMMADGATLDDVPVDAFWGEAAVIDLRDIRDAACVTADDLKARGSHVRSGDVALMCSAIGRRYSNETPAFWANSPYLDRSAAEWLVDREVKCVGYDFSQEWAVRKMFDFAKGGTPIPGATLSLKDWPVHEVLLRAGIVQVEHLVNLDQLRESRVLFFGLPLKIHRADGGPCRAFALDGVI